MSCPHPPFHNDDDTPSATLSPPPPRILSLSLSSHRPSCPCPLISSLPSHIVLAPSSRPRPPPVALSHQLVSTSRGACCSLCCVFHSISHLFLHFCHHFCSLIGPRGSQLDLPAIYLDMACWYHHHVRSARIQGVLGHSGHCLVRPFCHPSRLAHFELSWVSFFHPSAPSVPALTHTCTCRSCQVFTIAVAQPPPPPRR